MAILRWHNRATMACKCSHCSDGSTTECWGASDEVRRPSASYLLTSTYSERSLRRYLAHKGLRCNVRIAELDPLITEAVRHEFWASQSDSAIARFVQSRHGHNLSSPFPLRHTDDRGNQVKYIRRLLGLNRTGTIDQPQLNRLIQLRKRHYAFPMGYRRLTYHIRKRLKIWVNRAAVYQSLAMVDPEGLEERRKRRLKRRVFHADGPDQVWSLDGFDKLARWGFPIHGCVDVYSRYLLWLHVGISNRDPR